MESKAFKEGLFFKLFYRMKENEVKLLENKDLNNLFNHSMDVHLDFMKVDVNEILNVCNLENYNNKISQHYLSNENEYMYDGTAMREFHRNKTDKVYVLESIDGYLEIFTSIYVYDGIISPTYQRLVDFIEMDAIRVFTHKIEEFFLDLQENLGCYANIQEIILNITQYTSIFQDLTTLLRKRLNEDLSKYRFSKDANIGFLSARGTPNKKERWTDIHTLDFYPHHYNFLQKLFPKAAESAEKIVGLEIFEKHEVTVQMPTSKGIPNLRYTNANNIYHHPEVFINNALINFYRSPPQDSIIVFLSVVEESFALQKKDASCEVLYMYGVELFRGGGLKTVPPETLKRLVTPMRGDIKIIYKNL